MVNRDGSVPQLQQTNPGFTHRRHGEQAQRRARSDFGVLSWADGAGKFDYLAADWLKTFTRHNWLHR